MKQTRKHQSDAEHNEIDRILATEDALVPSSGFLASVMDHVQEEAAAPAPIPFPWKRALPGAIVACRHVWCRRIRDGATGAADGKRVRADSASYFCL
jgi:hypothetical protein